MTTWQVMSILALFMGVGLGLLQLSLNVARYFMQRDVCVSHLFINLKPKLWMTACLGVFFFSMYLLVVCLAAYFLNAEMKKEIFEAAHHNPTAFIYSGLLIFMSISLGILVVRSLIKKHYNAKVR